MSALDSRGNRPSGTGSEAREWCVVIAVAGLAAVAPGAWVGNGRVSRAGSGRSTQTELPIGALDPGIRR